MLMTTMIPILNSFVRTFGAVGVFAEFMATEPLVAEIVQGNLWRGSYWLLHGLLPTEVRCQSRVF